MKRSKKIYLGAGILAVMIIAALAARGGGAPVETVQVKKGGITRSVKETGYVQPSTNHDLYASQAARVIQVPVKTGQAVTKGQALAVLESLDLSMQINDARWQLSQAGSNASAARAALERTGLELRGAEDNLSRVKELYKTGAVSLSEYEKASLQVETLRHSLKEHNSRLESALSQAEGLDRSLQQLSAKERQLVVESPVNGTVLSLPVQAGQVLSPGALMASVAAPDSLEVKADILSDDLAEVREGQRAVITAPVLGGKTLEGRVKQIYPRAEEKTSALGVVQRRVPVIIALEGPASLKPGYEVKVVIETMTRQDVPVIPRESLRTMADGRKEAMVVANSRVSRRPVSTGIGDGEFIEITAGLEPGEVVVRDGGLDLPDKSKVKPQPAPGT
ncbi:MAG: efflux RND transporter periplasmic adaptor subunit [Bacillota bacterium]